MAIPAASGAWEVEGPCAGRRRTTGEQRPRTFGRRPCAGLAASIESDEGSPGGQYGDFTAAAQVPYAGAFVHAHGQEAAILADVAQAVASLAGARAANQGAVFAARRHFAGNLMIAV